MTESEWIELGKRRIQSVLRTNIACLPNQLEIKISEAGPTNQRVEPVLLGKARSELIRAGIIENRTCPVLRSNPLNFFYIPGTDGRTLNGRITKVTNAHIIYENIAQDKRLCGNVLEYMIQQAIDMTNDYEYFCTIYKDTKDGIVIVKDIECNSWKRNFLPQNCSLDIIAVHKGTGIPLGIEIKNKRPWKYADDDEVWATINKCRILGVMPIFINRKISDTAQFVFKKIGLLGMESQFQYFHPSQQNNMREVLDKKLLGFADIKFTTEPLNYMVEYFRSTIPLYISKYYETFTSNSSILEEYCVNRKMIDDSFKGIYRTKTYNDFRNEIGL